MKTESKAVEFMYQDIQIHFLLGKEENVMVNATEMAKMFDKRTTNYLANANVKELISKLELTEKSVNSNNKIIENRGHMGYYFCEILALDFATWLDVDFKIWVYKRIQEVLFGNAKIAAEKISEVAIQEAKIKKMREEILLKGSDDAKNLLKEEASLIEMKKNKNKAVSIFVKSNQPELPFD
jgi:hypothetical protein